jgi:hypothetical protein
VIFRRRSSNNERFGRSPNPPSIDPAAPERAFKTLRPHLLGISPDSLASISVDVQKSAITASAIARFINDPKVRARFESLPRETCPRWPPGNRRGHPNIPPEAAGRPTRAPAHAPGGGDEAIAPPVGSRPGRRQVSLVSLARDNARRPPPEEQPPLPLASPGKCQTTPRGSLSPYPPRGGDWTGKARWHGSRRAHPRPCPDRHRAPRAPQGPCSPPC